MADLSRITLPDNTTYSLKDGTLAEWVRSATKPTYTAGEVGALPDSTAIPSKISDLINDSQFVSSDKTRTIFYQQHAPINAVEGDIWIATYSKLYNTTWTFKDVIPASDITDYFYDYVGEYYNAIDFQSNDIGFDGFYFNDADKTFGYTQHSINSRSIMYVYDLNNETWIKDEAYRTFTITDKTIIDVSDGTLNWLSNVAVLQSEGSQFRQIYVKQTNSWGALESLASKVDIIRW